MARALYPINGIVSGNSQRFPSSIADLFEAERAAREDEFTYTARFEVQDEAARARIRANLIANEPDVAERFIALLDANDWSVSFLVDNY